MTTDKIHQKQNYEQALNTHYGAPNLGEEILAALDNAGIDTTALTRSDIASFEEFHIRGREATREVADLAAIEPDSRVLDIGCGIGGPARTIAAEYDCTVYGIDIVHEYCRAADLFTERVGLTDSVIFKQGNALDIPFNSEEFDVVWLEHTLMNIKDKSQVFKEANRVLTPGGLLVLYEICAGPGGDPVFPVPWASDESLSYLVSPEQLRENITDHGFTEIEWRDVTETSLEWFQGVVAAMDSRPANAPPPLGLNLLMGDNSPTKAANVVRCLEEQRIAVVQCVFRRERSSVAESTRSTDQIEW